MRNLIDFFKTPAGKITGFVTLLLLVLAFLWDQPAVSYQAGEGRDSFAVPATSLTQFESNVPPMRPPEKARPALDRPRPPGKRIPPPAIDLYTSESLGLGAIHAPFGRLIPAELVITVDSSRIDTPIIGLVMQDVWHAGQLVIPAGTEVHGTARLDRARERIASREQWTLVWTDGRTLPVTGLALDHAPDPDGRGWTITDGSAGLRGYVIKSDNLAELKFFAATFLSGVAAGFTDQETFQTGFGTTTRIEGNLKNAMLSGVSQTVNQYARQMLQRIRQDGFYVRVPAGTPFYLYVTQPLDVSLAQPGGPSPNTNLK